MATKQFTKEQLSTMTLAQLTQAMGSNEHGTSHDGCAPTALSAMNPTMKRKHIASAVWFIVLLMCAGIGLALLIQPAHGDSNMQPVAYVAAVMMNVKPEPTIIDSTSMTATPATVTPQPEAR